MPNTTIIDLIKGRMNGWDGNKEHKQQTSNQLEYNEALETWARKVRRDILVLEYHLEKLMPAGQRADMFYGDPGDPPTPPET